MGKLNSNIVPEVQFFAETFYTTTCYFNTTLNTTECGSHLVSTRGRPPSRPPFSLWLTILMGVIVCLVSLLTIFGNVVMILAFVIEDKIRQPSNFFVVSIAVTDLIMGSFSMPLYSLYFLRGSWVLGHWMCEIWLSVDWSIFLTALYTILLMTLNRLLENKFAVKYRRWRSKKKVLIAIALLYLIPAGFFFTLFIILHAYEDVDLSWSDECDVPFLNDALFTSLFVVGYYWTTMLATCILHAVNYQSFGHVENKSEEKRTEVAESPWELSTRQSKDAELTNTQLIQENNNNSDSVHRVAETKTDNTRKTMKDMKCVANVRQYQKRWADVKSTPDKGFNAYNYAPESSEDTVDSLFVLNSKTRNPKMSKELFMTAQPTNNYMIGLRRLTSPCRLPIDSTDSLFPRNSPEELGKVGSSSSLNRPGKQVTLLPPREVRPLSQITVGRIPLTAISSPAAAWNPAAGQSERDALDTCDLQSWSIWERRLPSPAIFSDVFDLEIINQRLLTTGQTVTTDLPSACPAHTSTVCRYVLHEQHPLLDKSNLAVFIRVSKVSTQPINRPLAGVGVREDSQVNINNNNTNKDLDIPDPTSAARRSDPSATLKTTQNSKNFASNYYDLHQKPDVDVAVDVIPDEYASSLNTSHPSYEHDFGGSKHPSQHGRKEARGRSSLRSITLLLATYVMCWSPYHMLAIMIAVCPNCVNMQMYSLTYWLCYLSSCVNPICYAYANSKIKRAVIRVLKGDWKKT